MAPSEPPGDPGPLSTDQVLEALGYTGREKHYLALVAGHDVLLWYDPADTHDAPDDQLVAGWRYAIDGASPRIWFSGPRAAAAVVADALNARR